MIKNFYSYMSVKDETNICLSSILEIKKEYMKFKITLETTLEELIYNLSLFCLFLYVDHL